MIRTQILRQTADSHLPCPRDAIAVGAGAFPTQPTRSPLRMITRPPRGSGVSAAAAVSPWPRQLRWAAPTASSLWLCSRNYSPACSHQGQCSSPDSFTAFKCLELLKMTIFIFLFLLLQREKQYITMGKERNEEKRDWGVEIARLHFHPSFWWQPRSPFYPLDFWTSSVAHSSPISLLPTLQPSLFMQLNPVDFWSHRS